MRWTNQMEKYLSDLDEHCSDMPASFMAEIINSEFKLAVPLTRNAVLGKIFRMKKSLENLKE